MAHASAGSKKWRDQVPRRSCTRQEMYEVRWLDGMGFYKSKRYFSVGNAHRYARKIRTSVIHVGVFRIR